MTRFTIPNYGEEPSTEMVDFLNENPLDWDGDDSGIALFDSDGEVASLGFPGDEIYVDSDGVYKIEKRN